MPGQKGAVVAKFKGADKHSKRLRNMSARALVEARKLVFVLADMHATEAAISITTGSVSGKNHVPSLPGEPPMNDTGLLANQTFAVKTGPLKAESVSMAPYAVALEFGTSKMAERPFMRPAAKKVRKQAQKLAEAAKKRIVAGGTL